MSRTPQSLTPWWAEHQRVRLHGEQNTIESDSLVSKTPQSQAPLEQNTAEPDSTVSRKNTMESDSTVSRTPQSQTQCWAETPHSQTPLWAGRTPWSMIVMECSILTSHGVWTVHTFSLGKLCYSPGVFYEEGETKHSISLVIIDHFHCWKAQIFLGAKKLCFSYLHN